MVDRTISRAAEYINDLGPLFDVVVFDDRVIAVGLETMVVSEDGIQWTDLTASGGLSSYQQIIQDLLSKGKLITD